MCIRDSNKSVSSSKVAGTVAEKIKCLYGKASIPTVSDYRIVQLINAYHDSYYNIRGRKIVIKTKLHLSRRLTSLN